MNKLKFTLIFIFFTSLFVISGILKYKQELEKDLKFSCKYIIIIPENTNEYEIIRSN